VRLTAGMNLGPYEVLEAIGAGGMGEVYKARDTRLNRAVAVKVLPENVSENAELKQRFEREAQTIAALNHPHICVVHDVGQEGSTHYLVMEYLEGETLGQRLEKGPLPVEQALKYAIEIADGLDRAHQQGIIHRDLKPGNVMLTKSGAKLLDFGLAKFRTAPFTSSASAVPTQASDLTAHGSILGTVQYMAPEQIEGQEADARSDIFAFGAVLYEMVTGKKAFKGKSQASLIASILEHDPVPMATLQQLTPPALERAVQTCLAKKPEDRWQTAHDLRLQLQWIAEGGSQMSVPASAVARRKTRERLAWSLLAVAAMGLIALAIPYFRTAPVETTAVEFPIAPPEGAAFGPIDTTLNRVAPPYPAASPDGRYIAFLAGKAGVPVRIWVRPLDASETRVLAGTEGALSPFWSPDSRKIGFFAGGKLKAVDYSGGPVQVLCDAPAGEGGTWNREGVILFGNFFGGLRRVLAAGGESTAITMPDAAHQETSHRWPYFLPDGRHFLYLAQQPNSIYAGSLDSKETKRLLVADSRAVYAPPGYLLFVRQGTLMGQTFDAGRLELAGEPFRIAENVRSVATGRAAFSVSDRGTLVYRSGASNPVQRVVWFDRSGKQVEPINQTGDSRAPALSPDESRIVVERQDASGRSDIWMIDLARGTNSRLTFNPTDDVGPVWSPDGNRVVYASLSNGKGDLYQKLATGSGSDELIFKSDEDKVPYEWSSDGRFLLFRSTGPKTGLDIWVLPMSGANASPAGRSNQEITGDPKPTVFLQTPFGESAAHFSPDGKWIAYHSNESGRQEVYVQPFPPTGGKWQVSVDGGSIPNWRRDGRELFFMSPDSRLMAVDVELGPTFRAGVPKPLFEVPGWAGTPTGGAGRYAVSRDGKRFLFSVLSIATESYPIAVVLNWTAALKK